ncbi:MAG: MBL fold metallo-hydrolase [Phototrophicaceae bacterium]
MVDIYTFTHGTLKCTVINDGNIMIRPTSIFFEGASPDELVVALAEHDLPDDGLNLPTNIMLVERDDQKILVDCGSDGEVAGYEAELGFLFAGLDEIGVSVDEITHVILTHGHFDHVLACADDDGTPKFPNATYIMAKDEWHYWVENRSQAPHNIAMRMKLQGIKDQLQLVDPDADILDGVRLMATPGHTLHHIAVIFESNGEILLCPIDVMDHPLQGQHPTWGANWDLDREQSIASRYKILQHAADTNALVHAFHFPFPGLGRFTKDGAIWQWTSAT